MIVRYPAEAQLVQTVDGWQTDLPNIPAKAVRYAWTARGFRGHQRFYQTCYTVGFRDYPELIEARIDLAQYSLETLLHWEYRTARGRWQAAWRDIRQMAWARVPMPVKGVIWKAQVRLNRAVSVGTWFEDDD